MHWQNVGCYSAGSDKDSEFLESPPYVKERGCYDLDSQMSSSDEKSQEIYTHTHYTHGHRHNFWGGIFFSFYYEQTNSFVFQF